MCTERSVCLFALSGHGGCCACRRARCPCTSTCLNTCSLWGVCPGADLLVAPGLGADRSRPPTLIDEVREDRYTTASGGPGTRPRGFADFADPAQIAHLLTLKGQAVMCGPATSTGQRGRQRLGAPREPGLTPALPKGLPLGQVTCFCCSRRLLARADPGHMVTVMLSIHSSREGA